MILGQVSFIGCFFSSFILRPLGEIYLGFGRVEGLRVSARFQMVTALYLFAKDSGAVELFFIRMHRPFCGFSLPGWNAGSRFVVLMLYGLLW